MIRTAWIGPILGAFLLAGCGGEPQVPVQKFEGFAQGTTYHVSYWSEPAVDVKQVQAEVDKTLAELDKLLSNYRPDSEIEQFNVSSATVGQTVDAQIVALVRVAQTVSQLSGGCYDLTIKPLFELWGFQNDELHVPEQAAIDAALANVGMSKLEIVDDAHLLKKLPNLRVDLSSIAQGYSVGKVGETLEKLGLDNYLVEIGGELKSLGHKPTAKPGSSPSRSRCPAKEPCTRR